MSEEQLYDPAQARTFVDLLRWRAYHQPDRRAYTFLVDDAQALHATYAEVDRQARAIAFQLQQLGAAGAPVLLLYPPGLEYLAAFFGCLYAGAVAVPVYPPDPARWERTLPRLRSIAQDARPLVALTTAAIVPIGQALAGQDPAFGALRWQATDALGPEADGWREPALAAGTLAFLQYTSGSTAAPKGVMLTHANLLHNSALIRRCFGHTEASRGVIWLPPYHDMGLIGGILQPLYAGFPVVLMSPVSFLQRPLRWLEAISRHQATTSGGPNFAYDLCARKVTPEQRATLDLSSWAVAFNGAEPIRPDTLERFAEAFGPCGFRRAAFYPCYGLAEATLIVAGGDLHAPPVTRAFDAAALEQHRVQDAADQPGARVLTGCGRALPDQQIVIAHPATATICGPGQVGEIWVAGPSVARGYWGQPDATAETFQARPVGTGAPGLPLDRLANRADEGGPFLRTGDLGFLHDRELFITGRLKDLIIVRGRNHYPQDIEQTVEQAHPALRPSGGAAFTVEAGGEERLVIVQEVQRQHRAVDLAQVAGAIRQAVAAAHELHVYAVALLKPGALPKTSSGKVQRHASRAAFLAGSLDALGSDTLDDTAADPGEVSPARAELLALGPAGRAAALTAYLQAQIAGRLGLARSAVDPEQPVSALGLDSLMAVELQYAIEAGLGVVVPMTTFLQPLTIAQIAAEISARVQEEPDLLGRAAAPATPLSGEHPLSFGQRALWFLHQLAPASAAYHIASAVRIQGNLDPAALRRAFQQLVDRHPALRTTFHEPAPGDTTRREPFQRVHPHGTPAFEIAESHDRAPLDERLAAVARRPFDLQGGPLLRVHLFALTESEHALVLVVHHIVADFWSLTLLVQELSLLYAAECAGRPATLAPPTLHYPDYVRRQLDRLAGTEGARLWSYWRQQLDGAPTILNLPADRPRPPLQTYAGAAYTLTFPAELAGQLKALTQAAGATPYMGLLAVFQALLYRYTGQDDLLVGSPMTGRVQRDLADTVGYFVNPVVLRARPGGNPPFATFLAQVRQTVLAALAHQEYPFPLLVERLQPERDPSRSPLFQVMFILHKAHLLDDAGLAAFALGHGGARVALGELAITSIALEQQFSQFDLTLALGEVDRSLVATFQYNSDLFDHPTIARMAGHYATLLRAVAADPSRRLAELPLLTEPERRQLLVDWNATAAAYPQDACLQQLFEVQAARTPDRIALVAGTQQISYAALNRRANQLAHELRRRGVGPEVLVGIGAERSPAMVVGLLGILKAGGAYVPLDPSYPAERLAWMLEDAQVSVLLTTTDDRRPTTDEDRGLKIEDSHVGANQKLSSILYPPSSAWTVVDLVADWERIAQEPAENPDSGVTPENLAYVLYTSGSTGRPKGVAIAHRSVVALLEWARQAFTPQQSAGVLASTSISFDLSVFELFLPLSVGGAAILAENILRLPDLPAATRVTLVNTVPSAITELVRGGDLPPTAHTINLAGEPLHHALVQQLYQLPGVRSVFNLYGPSEDTTYSTWALVHPHDAPPPIGRPIANTQVYLLDAQMQPVPVGVPGELYIGGAGLARGYHGRPDLTAERFVPNPFGENKEQRTKNKEPRTENQEPFSPAVGGRWSPALPLDRLGSREVEGVVGGRLYKTGDLCRYRPDGAIEFLGRLDHQVKLRGFRVELGEIEAALLRHPTVREAVVVVYGNSVGDGRLVAYIVVRDWRLEIGDSGADNLQSLISNLPQELRAYLKQHLPDYMVPAAFVMLGSMPLTPNGKVDRRALPAPELRRADLEGAFQAPRTPVEAALARVWADVLQIDRVGIHDNFFALGGHSLLASQIVARLRETFQVELPLQRLFETPTVAGLARNIEIAQWLTQQRAPDTAADENRVEGRL